MFEAAKPMTGKSVWRPLRSFPSTVAIAAMIGLCAVAMAQSASAQSIELISRTDRGASAEGRSNAPALSFDGSVAVFASDALDLVPPKREVHRSDIFLQTAGEPTTRIVAGIDGEPNGASQVGGFAPTVSADGRIAAYASGASNLVDGDDNGATDIFVYDAGSGATTRVLGGEGEPDGTSSFPRLSADGRWLVYTSQASNLVPGDENGATDVFLYDRDSGVTRRLSVASDGSEANGDSRTPAISADGGTVAFISAATNLVGDAVGNAEQVYVHDVASGQTELASVATDGKISNGNCFLPDLSADGSLVAFKSEGNNLVEDGHPFPDENGAPDVFVRDRNAGTTERVSVDDFGNPSNGLSGGPAISDDGRFVAFISFASNFDPDDGNGFSDVFVFDRETGDNERVSLELENTGRPGGPVPDFPATMSGNGAWIGFASAAENLVDGDINNQIDSFIARDGGQGHRPGRSAPPRPALAVSGAHGREADRRPCPAARAAFEIPPRRPRHRRRRRDRRPAPATATATAWSPSTS